MSLRRAVGFLLTRPRATPRTAGAAGVAAAAFTAAGAFAVQYFNKGADESAARKEEEDMKARFEDWMKEYDKTYRDEEEKAMRFQLFKATVKYIESRPPAHRKVLKAGYTADFKEEERPSSRSCVNVDESEVYCENEKAARKEEDMKVRFEDWMKKFNRTYRDEEEKAMRFQLFKASVKRIESQPPAVREKLQPGYFADFKEEDRPSRRSCVNVDEREVYCENEKGELIIWRPDVKQGDMLATQFSA